VVLFGGAVGTALLDDTWVYAGGTWREVATGAARPPARQAASMAYDCYEAPLLMGIKAA